ncbi:MAG: hypothetical protein MK106_13620 [Mariniblastus sp.]|nr:hypothetical protein [Mariniblastus sp.]
MKLNPLKEMPLIVMVLLAMLNGSQLPGQQPLTIFILAGQSNTVGHARAHTIATLFPSSDSRDQQLRQMVFKGNRGVSLESFEAQLELGRKIDRLTGGISNDKLKKMPSGPEKTAIEDQVKQLKEARQSYKEMVNAACVVSDRVYINSIADRNKKSGKLGIGYGADQTKIGPEYGFGLSIAERVKGPILLIKTSWGGKSLNYNFRPPSAGTYQLSEKEESEGKAEEIRKNASLNYRMMNQTIHETLANLKDHHPDYDPNIGHRIAGFVWFQGYNDQFSPEFRDNYKNNMISFIKDIRKEYNQPSMPFVIGVLGTGVTAEKVAQNQVSVGQREAANAPEFKDNVEAVESYIHYSHYSHQIFKKGWPEHYHEWDTVGSDRPYHYLGSGAFFVRLGDAFADSMVDLMGKQPK